MATVSVYDLLDDINVEHWYDITKPPGLAGKLAEDIAKNERREQPRLRAIAAMHELLIASGGRVQTPSGMKGNLLTICIAESAGGKDKAQEHFKKTAMNIEKGQHVFGRIASSKDIGRTLVNSNGVATFVIDECHSLFSVMTNKNGAAYMQELGSEILSVYSDRLKKFSDLDIINAKEALEKEIKKLHKKAKDKGIVENEVTRQEALLEREILLPIMQGVEDPIFSMMCFSTPEKMSKIISQQHIESGLIGRAIFVKSPEGRERKRRFASTPTPEALINQVKEVAKGQPKVAKYDSEETAALALMLDERFEDLRNDENVGAVIARSWEQVEKVATALSLGNNGIINEAMIMWSYCFVVESLLDVVSMLKVNEAKDEVGTLSRWNEIKNRIENTLRGKTQNSKLPQSKLIERVVKTQALRGLAQSLANNAGEEFSHGAETLILPVVQELIKSRAIDCVGRGYWINDPKKFEKTKISAKFMQIVDGVGMASYMKNRG